MITYKHATTPHGRRKDSNVKGLGWCVTAATESGGNSPVPGFVVLALQSHGKGYASREALRAAKKGAGEVSS
jgi:hypothetical protein